MAKDLYFEVESDGYHIYDRNDALFHIHQYEPYIPAPSKSYEENAQAQIDSIMAAEATGTNKFGLTDEQIAEIEQDYRDRLVSETEAE